MERLREILMQWNEYKKWIMLAAAVLIMITAVFIYGKDNNQTITLEEAEQTQTTDIESEENTLTDTSQPEDPSRIYVDIDGEVKNPGVYQIGADSRIFQVIEEAGGLTKNADTSSINQAETVYDGAKIHIPGKGEAGGSPFLEGAGSPEASAGTSLQGKININTAGSDDLQKLPGIGQVTASKIIDYRTANGSFHSIEDIMNVSGIGDKTFEKIRDQITV